MEQKTEQAINLIKQVCANHRGSLQEHTAIQTAVKTIEDAIKTEEVKEE